MKIEEINCRFYFAGFLSCLMTFLLLDFAVWFQWNRNRFRCTTTARAVHLTFVRVVSIHFVQLEQLLRFWRHRHCFIVPFSTAHIERWAAWHCTDNVLRDCAHTHRHRWPFFSICRSLSCQQSLVRSRSTWTFGIRVYFARCLACVVAPNTNQPNNKGHQKATNSRNFRQFNGERMRFRKN